MRNVCNRIVGSWGTQFELNVAHFLWISAMFAVLAGLEHNRIGLFLVPPFGATLTILLLLPEVSIAQPYAVIAGSVMGAGVGTLISLFAQGLLMAIIAAVVAFGILNLVRAYHPPGIALAMYPLLLHTGHWFPLTVVLPFTVLAVGSAALLSRHVEKWPAYPKPLTNGR